MGCAECEEKEGGCPCKQEIEQLKQAITVQQAAYEREIAAREDRIRSLLGAAYVLSKEAVQK